MKLHSLTCPKCNANLDVENDLDTFYCKYCGNKILIGGQSDEAYRAKTELASMKHDEIMARERHEHKQKMQDKEDKSLIKLFICIYGFLFLVISIPLLVGNIKSNRQEKQLQSLVDEIQIDIKKGDFDTAFLKAESIDYTVNYSEEIDDKWDNIRIEIKNQIIEAEKEKTGKSNHKPERKKFLGIF